MSKVDIAISARDNFSSAIKTMRDSTTAFKNDANGLQDKLSALDRLKTSIKIDMRDAGKNLKELEKEYDELRKNSDVSAEAIKSASDKIKNASETYEGMKRNLKLVNGEIRNTESAFKNLDTTQNKISNRASNINMAKEALKGFAFNMIAEQGSQILQEAAMTGANSLFGSSGGNIASNAISSAVSGMTAGAMLGGTPGAAVGALLGGTLGATQGIVQNFSAKDDAFKSYVQESVTTQQQAMEESMTNGTSLASQREVDKISFTTLFGGSAKTADSFLSGIVDFANSTPFLYDDLTSISKTLLTYGYKSNEIMEVLQNVGDAGAALGMDTAGMASVATGLGRMRSSGKTSLEYVNLMQERGIDAIGALAQAHGITNAEVYEGISQNLFDGAESAKIISDYMSGKYNGSMKEISETYQGLSSTLQGLQDELDNAMGEGYTEKRKEGIQNQINYLGSESGETMKEAYKKIGDFKAEQENLKWELEKTAIDTVMQSDEYKNAEASDNAAEMGKLLMEAKIKAQNEYNNTEGAQLIKESEKSLISSVREDTVLNEEYWNAGYELGQEFSKGVVAGKESGYYNKFGNGNDYDTNGINLNNGVGNNVPSGFSVKSFFHVDKQSFYDPNGFAYGLSYVPYNGYPATLHEGERVLTAAENRNYGKSSGRVVISGNNFTVREDADIDKIASALLAKIEQADLSYYG